VSMFYCEYHGKLEDADWVNCHEDPRGDGMVCDDGLAEIEEEAEANNTVPNNRPFNADQLAFIKKMEEEGDKHE
jgi:hypothetical protein